MSSQHFGASSISEQRMVVRTWERCKANINTTWLYILDTDFCEAICECFVRLMHCRFQSIFRVTDYTSGVSVFVGTKPLSMQSVWCNHAGVTYQLDMQTPFKSYQGYQALYNLIRQTHVSSA